MKFQFRWIIGIALAFIIAVMLVGSLDTAAAVDKWSADPSLVMAADFCDDPDDNSWYQVQYQGRNTGRSDWYGSTVACSGWAAIYNIAIVRDYASVDAAAADGWSAGNRNQPWVSGLINIADYGG